MSNLRTLPQAEWGRFLDQLSKALLGKWAEIEVASLDLGDQVIAEWIPMLGITYDTRDNLIDVGLERLDHLIREPRQMAIEDTTDGVASIAVVDGNGARQVIRFKTPVALPQPRYKAS